MSWLLLFGLLSFVSGYHLDNQWIFLLSGVFLFIAAIPLLMDYPVTVVMISVLTAAVKLHYFPPAPWYMHAVWVLLILVVSVPITRNIFFKN